MRIIVLSQWYEPEPDVKIHVLARDLAARGHAVTSVTSVPNYPSGRVYDGYHLRPWPQVESRDGVRVIRVPLYPDHSRSALKRVANYGTFATSAAFWGTLLVGSADVMWVYHPPLTVAVPALAISAVRRVPFVYEVQDMWPETVAATGMLRAPVALDLLQVSAHRVYRRARFITVISDGFKRNLVAKGVPPDKIVVMPNWADEDVYAPRPPKPALGDELGMTGRFNVLYAGNLGAAQGLDNVLDAAVLLRDVPAVQILLAGEGVEEPRLRARAADLRLESVRFLGRMPPERIVDLAALSQVMLVHLRRDPLFEITIPSKTISAMACGRPVLTVAAGDAADVVTSARAGMACPPDDAAALARHIRALQSMPAEEREQMGRAGRDYFLAHFTRSTLVPRYEELLREAACA